MKNSSYRNPENVVRVAVVEDHLLVRQGLVMMLKKEPQVEVVMQAENGREFLEHLPKHTIDVVLLDLDLPIMDGRDTLLVLQKDFPEVKTIMLSMHEDPWIVSELIKEGAKSFLKKNCSFDALVDALFDVKFTGSHTTEIMEQAMAVNLEENTRNETSVPALHLSARDQLILKQICDGKTSQQIADQVNLSKKSIDAIRSDLLKQVGAKNPTEFLRKCILLGLYKVRTDEQITNEEELNEILKSQRKYRRKENDARDSEW
jgi:DNA-binding NarL/FixJ family response regulator